VIKIKIRLDRVFFSLPDRNLCSAGVVCFLIASLFSRARFITTPPPELPGQPSSSSIEDRTPPRTTTSNFRSDRTCAYVGQHDQNLPIQIVFWHGACVDPALSARNKGGGQICRRHQAASHHWPSISPRQNFTILISFPRVVWSLSWYIQDQLLLGWLRSLILVPVLAQVIYCQTSTTLWASIHELYNKGHLGRIVKLQKEMLNLQKGSQSFPLKKYSARSSFPHNNYL
jgi:hypothetical protein